MTDCRLNTTEETRNGLRGRIVKNSQECCKERYKDGNFRREAKNCGRWNY